MGLMKWLTLPLALCLAATVRCADQPAPSDRNARADAHLKLRLEYAASAAYNPYAPGLQDIRRKSAGLLEAGDFDRAIAEAETGLALDRLNIDLLMAEAAAYRAKGDLPKADELRGRWMSLVDSIIDRRRGDGKSFATAFQVISVDEEYAVLAVFKLRRVQQSLVENGGRQYDVLNVQSKETGEEFELFFNVDIPMKWLHARLSKAKPDNPSDQTAKPTGPPAANSDSDPVNH